MDFSWTISPLNPLAAEKKRQDWASSALVQPHQVRYQVKYFYNFITGQKQAAQSRNFYEF